MVKQVRTIEAFAKGLRILEYVLLNGEFRISELASSVGIPISNTTLFLNTLIEAGYVRRGESAGLYRVTDHLTKLVMDVTPTFHTKLQSAAAEPMRKLHENLDENVLIAVMDRHYTTHYIAKIVADHVVQIRPDAGEHFPLYRTAHGRAILAFLDEGDIGRSFNAMFRTDNPDVLTEKEIDAIRSELQISRQRGYAVNRGEFEKHIMAVAAPIFYEGSVVASIVVQLPTFRHSAQDLDRYGAVVVQAAKEIETLITSDVI